MSRMPLCLLSLLLLLRVYVVVIRNMLSDVVVCA